MDEVTNQNIENLGSFLPSVIEQGKIPAEIATRLSGKITASKKPLTPSKKPPSLDDVMKVIDKKIAGETWRERVKDWFANGGSVDDIIRIAETETHRIANTAALDAAKEAGATEKTWLTMIDDRVRSTHEYLEGMTVDIDEDFYTYDGDHASAPGLFELAQNNINCRCELIFS